MLFSSLLFVFAYLPITFLFYFLSGKHFRNIVLLIASLFFYAWGEPVYVMLMCASILFNYFVSRVFESESISSRKKTLTLWAILGFNLGCLAYFKYFGMMISTLRIWHSHIAVPSLPIGISFYTFQILSYVFDVFHGKIKPQSNLPAFALYITMFPQLVAGPIVNYADIKEQLEDRSINLRKFNSGMRCFICGLAKKVLLANNIGLLWSQIKGTPFLQTSVLMAWAGIIAYILQIYFDFCGYSDMAIGLGKMFGFRFKENFKYPYISQSISEFWRRWHISLGCWFREYVYFPLGGSRVGKWKLIRNMIIVWLLTGLWHGASWNFVLWGLYFGLLILLERLFLLKWMKRWPKFLRHLYSLFFVMIGWVLFEFTNLMDALEFLKVMAGLGGNSFLDYDTMRILRAYIPLITVGIVAATPWPMRLTLTLQRTYRRIYPVVENVYYLILMFFSTAYMVASTYNPFIYFRF